MKKLLGAVSALAISLTATQALAQCDDGDSCTSGDACDSTGVCVGTPSSSFAGVDQIEAPIGTR